MGDHVVTLWTWNLGGFEIPITNVVVMSWIAMGVIILWAFLSTRKLRQVPRGLQNSAEIVVETLNNFAENNIHHGKSFAPYLGTIGLFLAISNTIGALFMTKLTNGIICPPTRTMAVPVALAIMTIVIAIGAGIKRKGIIGFIKRLFKPMAIMFPFNLLEFIIKPLSLSMRLFGNVFGAYVAMELLLDAIPWGLPAVACLYFDLFDGGLQTYVFVLLTTLYISEEVEIEEEEPEKKPFFEEVSA
ncbi:MAG: F0F1 ATP synthase subunit A [Clostridia bacterium]|nr:F0F1 ATP synthase subunit A [Clostridia bacterium]